jgi:hypothetical protein
MTCSVELNAVAALRIASGDWPNDAAAPVCATSASASAPPTVNPNFNVLINLSFDCDDQSSAV